ncbi:hypothetical protein OT109_19550 [Phycisphaeraceae bacterium D3-23]
MPSFDAELNTNVCDRYNNADLTITLKIQLKPVDPDGGKARGEHHDYGDATEPKRKTIKWTNASWVAWKSRFIRSAQRYWHGKFWLANNFNCLTYEDRGTEYRPNLYCRFRLLEADSVASAHETIEVVRLHRSEKWMGSHSTLFNSLDIENYAALSDSKGNKIYQRAHVHEVGHLLGLGHVDEGKAHCPASNTNASACYGVADEDMYSVMGSGMQLRTEFANPWRRAAVRLTRKGSAGTMSDWKASMKRIYPRNHWEILSNAKITRRPSRK